MHFCNRNINIGLFPVNNVGNFDSYFSELCFGLSNFIIGRLSPSGTDCFGCSGCTGESWLGWFFIRFAFGEQRRNKMVRVWLPLKVQMSFSSWSRSTNLSWSHLRAAWVKWEVLRSREKPNLISAGSARRPSSLSPISHSKNRQKFVAVESRDPPTHFKSGNTDS